MYKFIQYKTFEVKSDSSFKLLSFSLSIFQTEQR